jgi:hypothetical protein
MLSIDDTDHRLLLPVVIGVALAVLAAPMAQASEASPTPQSQIPGAGLTGPIDINDRGQVVGQFQYTDYCPDGLRDRSARFTTILASWPAAVATSPSEIDGEDSAREKDRTRWQPRSRAARRLEADGQLRGSQRFGGVVRQVESHRGAALRAGKQSQ